MLTTTCPHCLATLSAWNQLADTALADSAVDMVGLSLDGGDSLRGYLAAHPLPFPVVVFADPTLRFLYRAASVPQTIVLDDQGRVVHLRRGRLDAQAGVDSLIRIMRSRRGTPGARISPVGKDSAP